MSAEPSHSIAIRIVADYGQFFVYDPERCADALLDRGRNVLEEARSDSMESRRYVGTAAGLVSVMTPGQYNFRTPVLIEVWAAEPADDRDDWQHEVDVDLDVPSGELVFEASGGSGRTTTRVPAGLYRARVSGRGYTGLGHAGANGEDTYRLRLWPRAEASAPALRKSWPGWDPAAWPEPSADEEHAAVAEAAARITAAVLDRARPAVSGSVTVLRHRATFDATRRALFRWLEMPHFWLGSGGWGDPTRTDDGWFIIYEAAGLAASGRVLRRERPQLIAFTWSWDREQLRRPRPEHETDGTRFPCPPVTVEFTLRRAGALTVVDLTLQDVPVAFAADLGVLWAYYLRRLGRCVSKEPTRFHPWLQRRPG